MQNHDYRLEQSSVSSRSNMSDVIRAVIHDILEGPYSENNTISGEKKAARKDNFEKLKNGYSTCMDENSIKQAGVAPLRELLDELEVHYPVTARDSSSTDSNDELTSVLAWLSKNSVSVLVSLKLVAF
jgi:endothelin-converting enzyme